MFHNIRVKIHMKLERLCVKAVTESLKAHREKREYKMPWWFKFVNKMEFFMRRKLFK